MFTQHSGHLGRELRIDSWLNVFLQHGVCTGSLKSSSETGHVSRLPDAIGGIHSVHSAEAFRSFWHLFALQHFMNLKQVFQKIGSNPSLHLSMVMHLTDMSNECILIIIKVLLCDMWHGHGKLSHFFITCKVIQRVVILSSVCGICVMMMHLQLTDSSAQFSAIAAPDVMYMPCRMKMGKNILDWQYTPERHQWVV